jgi:hypothetical protein
VKARPTNPQLEWLLKLTASQFLVSPHHLRRHDRQAWRVAARDAFCAVAHMHQLGSQAEIAGALGRDLDTVRTSIARAVSRLAFPGDVVSIGTSVLGQLVARAKLYREGPFQPAEEMAPKTPPKGGVARGCGGPTRRPPSRASTPGPIAACRDSSRPLTSSSPK